jgi:hypothetical protein
MSRRNANASREAMKRALVLAVIVIFTRPSEAGYRVIGEGSASCGTWTEARDRRSMPDESWVLGFLAGIGFMGDDGADPLKGIDGKGVAAWIDNYCASHPIETVVDAAQAFYREHPR